MNPGSQSSSTPHDGAAQNSRLKGIVEMIWAESHVTDEETTAGQSEVTYLAINWLVFNPECPTPRQPLMLGPREPACLLPSALPGQAGTPQPVYHLALDSAPWSHSVPSSGTGSLVLRHTWLEAGGWGCVSWGGLSGQAWSLRSRLWGSSPPADIRTLSSLASPF